MTARCEWCGRNMADDDLVDDPGDRGYGPGPITWCRDADACQQAREAPSGVTELSG